jgi:hypothetical protein
VNKLLKVKHKIKHDSPIAFLKDYKYILGHDELVKFGAQQCVLVIVSCGCRKLRMRANRVAGRTTWANSTIPGTRSL